LDKFVSRYVRLYADQDADFLNLLKEWIEFVKAADEEISHQAVEVARTILKQDGEAIPQAFAGLIRDESYIRRYRHGVCLLSSLVPTCT
jgi:soluble cytochrome b562